MREIASATCPSPSWVNTHLQYTHGNGAVGGAVQPDQVEQPGVSASKQVPPQSSPGLPQITQPDVYFGLGETGYVVANSKQLEVDYQKSDGSSVESHYSGTGGVQLSSLFKRAAFALRLGDLNLLISSQITDKSRIMFVRDPVAMAEKAAPFLTFDHDPYAVINERRTSTGWSTATPRRRTTPTRRTPTASRWRSAAACPANYNYVRNSVKVIIDAYSGKMTFYDVDPKDPIIQAYEAAFPHMFTPLSKMPASLQAHLRYPPDIFSIQSAIYGRYHLTNPRRSTRRATRGSSRRRPGAGPQVAGAAGREHLQLPGPAGLDDSGPHGTAVPGVLAARHEPAGVHRLRRLRPGVARVSAPTTTRTTT